jgi:hypothetical protein
MRCNVSKCTGLRGVRNNIGFASCSLRLVLFHTDTLYQPDETGKREGKMTKQIKTYFHTYQGVFHVE